MIRAFRAMILKYLKFIQSNGRAFWSGHWVLQRLAVFLLNLNSH